MIYKAASNIHGNGLFTEDDTDKDFMYPYIAHHLSDQGAQHTEFGGSVNHSDNPNAKLVVVGDKTYIKTTKKVPKHTELTIDYNKTYNQDDSLNPYVNSMFEPDPTKKQYGGTINDYLNNLPIPSPDKRYAEYQDLKPIWDNNIKRTPIFKDNKAKDIGIYNAYNNNTDDPLTLNANSIVTNPRLNDRYDTPTKVLNHEQVHAAFNGNEFIPDWYEESLYNNARNPNSQEHQDLFNERAVNNVTAGKLIKDFYNIPYNQQIPEDLYYQFLRDSLKGSLRNNVPMDENLSEVIGSSKSTKAALNTLNFKRKGGSLNPYQKGGLTPEIYKYLFDDEEDDQTVAAPVSPEPVKQEEQAAPDLGEQERAKNLEYEQQIAMALGDYNGESISRSYSEGAPSAPAYVNTTGNYSRSQPSSDPQVGSDKGQFAFKYLQQQYNLPPHVAAGIVGNFTQESGNFRDDVIAGTKAGDSGLAHGIAQWHGDRWKNMQEWARSQGKNPYTLPAQLDFAMYEASKRGDLQKTLQTTNSKDAANVFAKHYERPKIVDSNRARFASKYSFEYGGVYEELFK